MKHGMVIILMAGCFCSGMAIAFSIAAIEIKSRIAPVEVRRPEIDDAWKKMAKACQRELMQLESTK